MLQRLRGLAVTGNLLFGCLCLARLAPSAASTPNLTYYGGPVVSHAIVVPVNWNSDVDATLQNDLPQFYADLVQSTYWDMLAQYSTVGATPQDSQAGSGQLIARGSATAGVTIAPLQCPAGAGTLVTPCPVTEADIDDEINRQIDLDILPAPSLDAIRKRQHCLHVELPGQRQSGPQVRCRQPGSQLRRLLQRQHDAGAETR